MSKQSRQRARMHNVKTMVKRVNPAALDLLGNFRSTGCTPGTLLNRPDCLLTKAMDINKDVKAIG